MRTWNPSTTTTVTITVQGSIEAAVARVLGITEADVRSVRVRPDVYELDVRTWNRRTLFVAADDLYRKTRN